MYDHDHEREVTYFAKTNFRNKPVRFGIKTDDRRRHVYIIGKTGMGKTTLMENMILSDIYAGHGCCYVDPHGDTAEKLIDYIPAHRLKDVIYFNPGDLEFPMGFNILEAVSERHKHLVASGMMGVFKKIWENLWSARMEYILNNTILALLENPGSTLLGINRMFSDSAFREKMVSNVKDPIVKQFWVQEYAAYSEKFATEAVAAIQNKIGQFLSASIIRNIVAQVKSTFNIREIMDNNKIFIVNLSKGRIGEDNSRLIGGLLITKLQLAAMERVDTPESERKDFYLYVDEFQNFAVDSFASILSEARKYRLCLTIAHQYIAQLSDAVREAVFGNVGTAIAFRVGAPDATFLEQEFTPRFTAEDLVNLPKFNMYLKLLIDGVASQPFSAVSLPPIAQKTASTEKVIDFTHAHYCVDRQRVEDSVALWTGIIDGVVPPPPPKKPAPSRKYKFSYSCQGCTNEFGLDNELDPKRPIFCRACLNRTDEERKAARTAIEKQRALEASLNGEATLIVPTTPSEISAPTLAPAVSHTPSLPGAPVAHPVVHAPTPNPSVPIRILTEQSEQDHKTAQTPQSIRVAPRPPKPLTPVRPPRSTHKSHTAPRTRPSSQTDSRKPTSLKPGDRVHFDG